jgi:Txe/YoeB family toxin of Txe-Axe toxin-antitoxin module
MVIPKTSILKIRIMIKTISKTPKNGIKKAYPLKSKFIKIEIQN